MFATFRKRCQMMSPFLLSHFLLIRSFFCGLIFIIIFIHIFRCSCFKIFSALSFELMLIRFAMAIYILLFVPYWNFHLELLAFFTRHIYKYAGTLVGLQFLSQIQFEMHILSHANERWNDDDGIVSCLVAGPFTIRQKSERAHIHIENGKHTVCRLTVRSRAYPHIHAHSSHIKYASSSAVYLTSSAIKMLILHCIQSCWLRMHFSIFLCVFFPVSLPFRIYVALSPYQCVCVLLFSVYPFHFAPAI